MSDEPLKRPVERLFPFVLRTRGLLVGRETLRHSRGRLHFVLVTKDLTPGSLREIVRDFEDHPVVQCYESADLERLFGVKGTKVVGFKKSGLSQSIYAELKEFRIEPGVRRQLRVPPAPVRAPEVKREQPDGETHREPEMPRTPVSPRERGFGGATATPGRRARASGSSASRGPDRRPGGSRLGRTR